MITKEMLINYLQDRMDAVQDEILLFGESSRTDKMIDGMIACKEMVEAFIQEPVNLGLNGKVTVGF